MDAPAVESHLRHPPVAKQLNPDGGAIVATDAFATLRLANLTFPSP